MLKVYKHAVLSALGGRVAIYAVGEAMDVANEMSKMFGAGFDDNGMKLPSPADVFLSQYRDEKARKEQDCDSKMMLDGATMYNLGGIYVIHAEKKPELGILVHEVFHVVHALSESCGIHDDEFSAHIGQYLFELFAECPTIKTCEVRSDGLVQHDLFEEGLK